MSKHRTIVRKIIDRVAGGSPVVITPQHLDGDLQSNGYTRTIMTVLEELGIAERVDQFEWHPGPNAKFLRDVDLEKSDSAKGPPSADGTISTDHGDGGRGGRGGGGGGDGDDGGSSAGGGEVPGSGGIRELLNHPVLLSVDRGVFDSILEHV